MRQWEEVQEMLRPVSRWVAEYLDGLVEVSADSVGDGLRADVGDEPTMQFLEQSHKRCSDMFQTPSQLIEKLNLFLCKRRYMIHGIALA
jgi:hypothetical protein